MKVAVYWEQDSWGGVDSHLLELLSHWPSQTDEFVLFYNEGNRGFERIRGELARLPNVRPVAVTSWSYNELLRQFRHRPAFAGVRVLLFAMQPAIFLLSVRRLGTLLSRWGSFDALIADDGGYPGSWGCLSAVLAAGRVGIGARLLLVHHEATRPSWPMVWFERLVDAAVSRRVSAIVCVSSATRHSLLANRAFDAHLVRLRVIHNGVTPVANPARSATDLRACRRTPGERLVGIVGRIEPYKGHEDLMFAMSRLRPECRNQLRALVIGSGEPFEEERLRRLAARLGIEERVVFTGYVEGPAIDLIAQLDLLVLATRSFEGFGLTVIEAMHAGTPVLATRVGAIPEIVDESTGVLVNAGCPDDMCRALEDFLCHGDEWRQRAERARLRLRRSGNRMPLEYRQLLDECIAAQ